jgi:hypothetical protein
MNRTRHSGIFNASHAGASIIGLGGIGAITAVTLAKMGVGYLKLVDFDHVSEENLATQLHPMNALGSLKTVALRDTIWDFVDDVELDIFTGAILNDGTVGWGDYANEIVISAVDSIKARHEIWEVIRGEPWQWYIDARMGAESLLLYVVKGDSRDWYSNLLSEQSDAAVPDAPCTSKATFFCGAGAACLIGKTVRQIVTGLIPPKVISWDILNDRMVTIG